MALGENDSYGKALFFTVLGVALTALGVVFVGEFVRNGTGQECIVSDGRKMCLVDENGSYKTFSTSYTDPWMFPAVLLGLGGFCLYRGLRALAARSDERKGEERNTRRRFSACSIDAAVVVPLYVVAVLTLGGSRSPDADPVAVWRPITFYVVLMSILGYSVWGGATGQTLGRRRLEVALIRVSASEEARFRPTVTMTQDDARAASLGWGRAVVRSLVAFLMLMCYGAGPLAALCRRDGRSLADLITGTAVVRVARVPEVDRAR